MKNTESPPWKECDHRHERFTCNWLQTMLVVLCDGKVVCGCADPYGERPLGDLSQNHLLEIWHSPLVKAIREDINRGHCCFCDPCGLKIPLADHEPTPQYPIFHEILPRIFLEPTAACNLDCFEAVCNKSSGLLDTRRRAFFPLNEFKTLMDEIGPTLGRLDLFNYGDPFVHPQILEMIEYVKEKYPQVYIYISTNGILLSEERNRRLIEAGLDEITFSVDGPDQGIYEKYRRGGDFSRVMENMKNLVLQRRELNRDLPLINWRCILFRWNDSNRIMKKVRKMASESGVDRLTWEITDHPAAAKSNRYQVGTSHWKKIYHEIWDTSQLSNAIKNKRHMARIRLDRFGQMGADAPGKASITVRIRNIGGALWRKQTANGRQTVRLGAQLHDKGGHLLDLNYARAFLPHDVENGCQTTMTIDLPTPPSSGWYRIKLDMVSEGVDWFERAGSKPLWLDWQVP